MVINLNLVFIYAGAFLFGGNAYCLIELLTRKRTHFSMFFCAGLAISILLFIYMNNREIPLLLFSLLGTLIITCLELIFGTVFNLWLKMKVWDYSKLPLNFSGQICVWFSGIWFGFGTLIYYLFRLLKL